MKIYFVRNLGQRFKNAMIRKPTTGQIKTWFKNPFNKEGFKRVIINSHWVYGCEKNKPQIRLNLGSVLIKHE